MSLFDVYPLFDVTPVKANDVYLYDDKGTQYLDLYGGHAVISIGHSHPVYVNASDQSTSKNRVLQQCCTESTSNQVSRSPRRSFWL